MSPPDLAGVVGPESGPSPIPREASEVHLSPNLLRITGVRSPDMANSNGNIAATTTKGKTSVSKSKVAKEMSQRLRKAQRAAILLKQASDPTRLQIMLTLADGE